MSSHYQYVSDVIKLSWQIITEKSEFWLNFYRQKLTLDVRLINAITNAETKRTKIKQNEFAFEFQVSGRFPTAQMSHNFGLIIFRDLIEFIVDSQLNSLNIEKKHFSWLGIPISPVCLGFYIFVFFCCAATASTAAVVANQ